MARLSTCKGCEKKITKEEKFVHSSKPYCKFCYDIKMKESEDYNSLLDTLKVCFEIDIPTGLMLKQIKDYKDQFKYVYSGMNYCLWYLKEIKQFKFEKKFGIAIIKYEYENAKAYFLQQQNIKKSANVKINDVSVVVKVNKHKSRVKDKLLLNLDDLINGGNNEV